MEGFRPLLVIDMAGAVGKACLLELMNHSDFVIFCAFMLWDDKCSCLNMKSTERMPSNLVPVLPLHQGSSQEVNAPALAWIVHLICSPVPLDVVVPDVFSDGISNQLSPLPLASLCVTVLFMKGILF